MADWTTVCIALITAGAGLGGSIIAVHFSMKSVTKTHEREDRVTLEGKVEELFTLLDDVKLVGSQISSRALIALNANAAPAEPLPAANLGRVRSLVGLYFPACAPALSAFDTRSAANTEFLRAAIQAAEVTPLQAGFQHALLEGQSIVRLGDDLRVLLSAQARQIGRPEPQKVDQAPEPATAA